MGYGFRRQNLGFGDGISILDGRWDVGFGYFF